MSRAHHKLLLFYTPLYAENPPSTGITTPFTKLDASLCTRNKSVPISSSALPNLSIGVAPRILPVLAVGVPSSLKRSF